jgi:hypothetical protein
MRIQALLQLGHKLLRLLMQHWRSLERTKRCSPEMTNETCQMMNGKSLTPTSDL